MDFESPNFWMYIVGFLLMLGPLVTLHELGHYLVGRWFGVKAEVFSVGFGKELWGRTDSRGTRWRLSTLPLGGYVQFAGDMNPASQPDDEYLALPQEEREKCFQSKKLWQKALIVAAGPVTNLLIAVAIFAGFAMSYGIPTTPPVVQAVVEGSPAEEAGLQIDDRFIAIDDNPVETFQEIPEYILPYPDKAVEITLERDGEVLVVPMVIGGNDMVDRFGNKSRIGQIGVRSYDMVLVPAGVGSAVAYGFDRSIGMVRMMITGIGQIISGQRSVKELGGPITMGKMSGEMLSLGALPFIEFVAFISLNLAFINLLPIPVLDGGHLAFYAAEAIRRKPASQRSQEWAFRTGLALVLGLMLFVTIIDIAKLTILDS